MASWLYNSFITDCATGNIDTSVDTFKCLLLSPSHVPSRTHNKRSNLTGTEVTGTNYTAGGVTVTIAVSKDDVNNRTVVAISEPTWLNLSVPGGVRYGGVYKSRGGADTADELVALLDFNSTLTPNNSTFATNELAPFYINHEV